MTEHLVARVYLLESQHLAKKILTLLRERCKIKGATIYRPISGFGDEGEVGKNLLELSFNLPLIVEFFDEKEAVMLAVDVIAPLVKQQHIIYWPIHLR
jgi:PII-like signaling protein